MKRVYQYLMVTGVSGLLCLLMALQVNAQQRGGGHSSGGGGGRSSGGGGGSFSRGGGGGGFSGGGRSSGGFSNGGGSFQRGGSSANSSRQSAGVYGGGNRSTNGFRPQAVGPQYPQRGAEHAQGLSFRRGGVGTQYRGGYGNTNRGGYGSIRGGYYRGGRYYSNGYGNYYNNRSFGYRYSPWYNRGGYYYNRGFYSSLYYPRLGIGLGVLPYGYYSFNWGSDPFFYSDGFFYQYNNNQYTVVEPPLGAAVNALPRNATAITINGQQFYESNGVYYTPITKDDGTIAYQVAGKDGQLDTYSSPENGYAPVNDGYTGGSASDDKATAVMPEIGDVFYSLPADSRKIKLGGQQYYVSPDDYYFQETRDADGKKAYKVMGTPDDAPGN